jgi:hypothetical protein
MPYSTDEIHDMLKGVANISIGLAIILLIPFILAPLFGGNFSLMALMYYGTWIGFSLCVKLEAKNIKAKNIGGYKSITTTIIELICIFIWAPFPYNLIGATIFSCLKYYSYRALKKRFIS